jgi:hypothetical protein
MFSTMSEFVLWAMVQLYGTSEEAAIQSQMPEGEIAVYDVLDMWGTPCIVLGPDPAEPGWLVCAFDDLGFGMMPWTFDDASAILPNNGRWSEAPAPTP